MPKLKDLTGQKFRRLLVIKQDGRSNDGHVKWLTLCDCGSFRSVIGRDIMRGHTVSCGCWKDENSQKRCLERKIGLTHGMSYSRLYNIWNGMIKRCFNKRTVHYDRYGGRGITVCDPWKKFINFKNDVFESYLAHVAKHGEMQTTLDRIDGDGNYEPSNCRWATWQEQRLNQ